MPLAKVEVAVEEEFMDPPSCNSPATESVLAKVEEALAIMFCASKVEEACKGEPETKRPEVKVEEAVEINPPCGVIEKRVEVAAPRVCWTWKALPVCPVSRVRLRRLAEVEVAPMVTWLSPDGEVWVVVPIIR